MTLGVYLTSLRSAVYTDSCLLEVYVEHMFIAWNRCDPKCLYYHIIRNTSEPT